MWFHTDMTLPAAATYCRGLQPNACPSTDSRLADWLGSSRPSSVATGDSTADQGHRSLAERRLRGEAAGDSDLADDEREPALDTARRHAPEAAEVELRHCEKRATAILGYAWSVVTEIASWLQTHGHIEGATFEPLLRAE